MAAFQKTKDRGIYKRGGRYLFSYRVDGDQRWESFRTLNEARQAKRARGTDLDRGEFQAASKDTLHEFGRQWVERYQGRGRRGFRESTRDDYRRQLDRYVFRFFPAHRKLTQLTPRMVGEFVAWLCDPAKQDGRVLADSTVRNIMAPLRACLSTAVREGIIRMNPAREVDLPHRPTIESDEDEIKAMSTEQLETFLRITPPRWHAFFHLLAITGVRISEAIALEWRHVQLDGSAPHIKVRQRIVRGQLGPPKSKYGKREIPITHALVSELRAHRAGSEWPGDTDPVFPSGAGTVLNPTNVFHRVLRPTAEEAGVAWAGFHTFRHTCATMLFANGRNAVQVQRWLGHHSPAFTLATYVHLLNGDVGGALELPQSVNTSVNMNHTTGPHNGDPDIPETLEIRASTTLRATA